MTKIRSMLVDQSIMGGPERRGDERSEAPRSGGSPIIEPDAVPVPPDSEVPARHARRRFTPAYKLAILRRADACTRYGELGARLRKEGLYSSHVVTWRQPREAGLTPKKRGRKMTAVDPQRKKLEQENRRLTSRLQKAEALSPFKKSFRTPTDPPEPVRERRGRLMVAVDDATPTLGAASACRVLGLPRASLYRGRRPVAVARPRPAPPRALDPIERQGILDVLHTRFIDQAPAQIHATLLDEGTYLCSPRTMYRVLDAAHEVKERRDQVRRPPYAAPELLATRPNEVWSWDITTLLGPSKWTYFYLYVILDIFSRYVVGWMLAPHERAALAEHLIGETCAKHGIQPGPRTLHADRGSSMKRNPVALLLADLGVTKTHSRPHVSNDNPFSEAQCKTLKSCPQCPERFGSLEDGRACGQVFFPWYNQEHRHSGLGFLTPAVVHFGQAPTVRAQRQQVLAAAYAAHPERFVKGRSQPADLPRAVWINPPAKNTAAQDAPGTTIVIMDDLRVDQSRDADDHVAVMIVDRHATLITAPLVSQCH